MKEAAKKEGVDLTLSVGYRPYSKQVILRKQNIIDKTKASDDNYIATADSSLFNPVTAKPGYSNHSDGGAYDFNVTDPKDKSKTLPSYKWLVKNALNFGFIRTVPSERWHWEYRPTIKNMFEVVPKNHPTWDNLI